MTAPQHGLQPTQSAAEAGVRKAKDLKIFFCATGECELLISLIRHVQGRDSQAKPSLSLPSRPW